MLWSEERGAGAGNAVTGVLAVAGGAGGWLVIMFGGTVALVLAIIVMARGAAWRGLLALMGFLLCAAGAVLVPVGMLAWRDARDRAGSERRAAEREIARDGAEEQSLPADRSRPGEREVGPLLLPAGQDKEMTLRNTKGVTITARVISVDDFGQVKVLKDGREFTIGISTLDAASQEKVRQWKDAR